MTTGIAAQDKALVYLSEKRVLLNSPGFLLDSVYYSALNSTVELSEVTWNTGRFSTSLTNQQFGAQSQITIPNASLLSNIYLRLTLPALTANQTLCRGWGYASIRNISYLFGSSNVSQISMSGQSMFQMLMLQSETESKRHEFMRQGGQEELGITVGEVEANLLLLFPWSSGSGLFTKLPIDTDLLQNPITIQITFNEGRSIYGGSDAVPVGFTSALVVTRMGDFKNRDMSLRQDLIKNPASHYSYPFLHKQSFTPASFSAVAGVQNSIPLLSFINADLVNISFGIIRNRFINPPILGETPSPFNYESVTDIQLLFNGLLMHNTPGNLWKLSILNSEISAGFVHNSVVDQSSTVAPFSSDPVDTYIITIDFSRLRTLNFEGSWANVWRIGNNTLELRFTTLFTDNYTLFSTYTYNAIAQIQNGQTQIFFD